jgi:hypothetical protein
MAAVRAPLSAAEFDTVKTLFRAYAAALDFDLGFQDFDAEMAQFPGQYATAAGGALRLALRHGKPIGAVGLRALGGRVCEVKRLYLAPGARYMELGLRDQPA